MATIKSEYNGCLRTSVTHVKSGNQFITDAPIDNNGKGETFSPTDTVAAAVAADTVIPSGEEPLPSEKKAPADVITSDDSDNDNDNGNGDTTAANPPPLPATPPPWAGFTRPPQRESEPSAAEKAVVCVLDATAEMAEMVARLFLKRTTP